jgi:hypothetical protein
MWITHMHALEISPLLLCLASPCAPQETFRVPKKVHRALGLRFKVGETGEVELVEKENARTRDLSVNAAFTVSSSYILGSWDGFSREEGAHP